MASSIYLAQFRGDAGDIFTCALRWPAFAGSLLPLAWWKELRQFTGLDIGIRLTAADKPGILMLLSASQPEQLTKFIEATRKLPVPDGLIQPESAEQFDEITSCDSVASFVRVRHEGFHHSGSPLGCDFRLYASWVGQGLPEGGGYQLVLRPFVPGREQERRTRKYLAWLNLEKPYTPAVRAIQEILCRRLLDPGWQADEYLLFPNNSLRDEWLIKIGAQFAEMSGHMGFMEPPVEVGDFLDWVTTGCHTDRFSNVPLSVPVQGACTFTDAEIEWFIKQDVTLSQPVASHIPPDIFVSYASADFAQADLVRQHLEGMGWHCWIAPRDINLTGLPYTEAIPRALKQVKAVIVILSPSANLSVHIPRELDVALEHRCPIVPMRLVDLQPSGQLYYLLRTCQWLDGFNRDQDAAMSELVARLRFLGL